MEILDGDYLVLGTVRPLDYPFIDSVRHHRKTALFELTERNRDRLFSELARNFENSLEQMKYPNGSK